MRLELATTAGVDDSRGRTPAHVMPHTSFLSARGLKSLNARGDPANRNENFGASQLKLCRQRVN